VFGLLVHDKAEGGWRAATDNAGLYKIFHDDQGASTSFLGLVRARRVGRDRVDPAALVEFLAHGQVFAPHTFVAGIHKLRGRELLELAPGAPPRLRAKALPAAVEGGTEAVLGRFAALARSLDGRALSVDATGGFDSRLIACLLHAKGLRFELAASGLPGTADTEIAATMARLLGEPFHLSGHDLDDLDASLVATFRAGDGLTDLRRFHRDRQLALSRLGRGVEVMAHGGGGEIFRDYHVIQDFPLYDSRRVAFGRFYDLRQTPVTLPPDALSPAGRELLAALKPATIARYEEHRAPTNSQTYDRVYYFLRHPEFFGQYYANYINMGLDVAAPFLDYDNAMIGIGLGGWRGFFHAWHRRVLTAHCPKLAALPTAEGFSASAEPLRVLADLRAYAATQLRRAGKKASQRLTGKTRFHTVGAFVADAPGFVGRLRGSAHFPVALERLRAAGVLAAGETGAGLRDGHVGRALTLGMFLGEVEGFS
jgi:hypothetical protein